MCTPLATRMHVAIGGEGVQWENLLEIGLKVLLPLCVPSHFCRLPKFRAGDGKMRARVGSAELHDVLFTSIVTIIQELEILVSQMLRLERSIHMLWCQSTTS